MALILNLETATTNCSVSLAKDGKLISIKEHNEAGYSHSENLHVFIAECLKDASLLPNDLEAVAVSKGPGSYTGLRIGVSAAKGLCFALDIPLIAISTLRCMVEQLTVGEGFIIPMLDARRLEVYSAVFDKERKEIRNTRAEIITPDSFEDYVKEGPVYLAGSGATKCIDILKHPNFVFEENVIPSSKDLAVLSYESFKNKEFEDNAYFEPDYLKKFVSNLSQ